MTTLTFDTSTLDDELEDLLAARWTVQLHGDAVDLTPRVITPPPSLNVVRWDATVNSTARGVDVLCDGEFKQRLTFTYPVFMRPLDVITVHLTLERGEC